MRSLKRLCKLNKEVTNDLCDEMGVEREQLFKILNREEFKRMVREAVEKEAKNFLGRRSFLEALALGAGITIGSMGLAKGDVLITNDNVIVKDPSTGLDWNLRVPMPFSAIVGIEGRKVRCYDGRGKLIDSGKKGVDDARVIQSGVDFVGQEGGGRVVIKGGEYNIKNSIDFGNKHNIIFTSELNTKFVVDGVKCIIIGGINGSKYSENIKIQNIKIYGLGSNGTEGIYIGYSKHIIIENVIIYGSFTGRCIDILYTPDPTISYIYLPKFVTVKDCYIHNETQNSYEAILIGGRHNSIYNCYIESANGSGIFIYDCVHFRSKDIKVIGNTIIGMNGMEVGILASCVDYTVIENNYINGNGYLKRFGIGASSNAEARNYEGTKDWGNIYIINNRVENCKGHGIRIAYLGHDINIEGNYIKDNGGCGIIVNISGITMKNVKIIKNTCINNLLYKDEQVDPPISSPARDSEISIYSNTPDCYSIYIEDNFISKINATYNIGFGSDNLDTEFIIETLQTISNIKMGVGVFKYKRNSGTTSLTGDGTSTTLSTTVAHGLVSDKFVARAIVYDDTVTNVVCIPVDADGDGFYESIKIVATFSSAPASGATIPVYWEAEVVS